MTEDHCQDRKNIVTNKEYMLILIVVMYLCIQQSATELTHPVNPLILFCTVSMVILYPQLLMT